MKTRKTVSSVTSSSRRRICAAAVAIAGWSVFAPAASFAADRFAVVSIANETNANINMVYRRGGGVQKTHYFAPGTQAWFSHEYSHPNEDRSPDFNISFDSDTTARKYSEPKKLHGYRAPDQSYQLGHKYVFRYDGPSKRFIEIYDNH